MLPHRQRFQKSRYRCLMHFAELADLLIPSSHREIFMPVCPLLSLEVDISFQEISKWFEESFALLPGECACASLSSGHLRSEKFLKGNKIPVFNQQLKCMPWASILFLQSTFSSEKALVSFQPLIFQHLARNQRVSRLQTPVRVLHGVLNLGT